MKSIFDSTMFGDLKLKNRLVQSATGHGLATSADNMPDELIDTYVNLAKGGVGMIILEFSSVTEIDHFEEGLIHIDKDEYIPGLKRLVDSIHEENCVVIPQLSIGRFFRKISNEDYVGIMPKDMTKNEIHEVIDKFVKAAARAKEAGFDGVQLHCAHGFLLSQFISAVYNKRTDEFGLSTEGRIKIVIEIIKGIRKAIGDFHISIKINCSDFIAGGLTPEECIKICSLLEECGLDSIEVSGNGPCVSGIIPGKNESFFAPFAKVLKTQVDIPIIVTGGHRSIENMNKLLNEDGIEYFSMSRPLIREPHLPSRWLSGDLSPAKCISCNGCFGTHGHKCIFDPVLKTLDNPRDMNRMRE